MITERGKSIGCVVTPGRTVIERIARTAELSFAASDTGGELPGRGLEPLILSEPDPKSGASANFATPAYLIIRDLRIK